MIAHEIKYNDIAQKDMCYTSSPNGYMIRKIGTDELYSEAWDILPCQHEYEETDVIIDTYTESNQFPKMEQWRAEQEAMMPTI